MNGREWNQRRRGFKTFQVRRRTAAELDKAIKDLEKRGYKCIHRGVNNKIRKDFRYRDNFGPKYSFAGDYNFSIHWAIMQKEEAV